MTPATQFHHPGWYQSNEFALPALYRPASSMRAYPVTANVNEQAHRNVNSDIALSQRCHVTQNSVAQLAGYGRFLTLSHVL
ncbi:hypothetical protein BDR03DRAFT_954654 [Suillus americanus]|nr:hypothetical protein BDR03DRAFT_954654 [Suillus americanus]